MQKKKKLFATFNIIYFQKYSDVLPTFAAHFFSSRALTKLFSCATSHWENVEFIEILWKDSLSLSPPCNYVKAI